MEQRGVADGDLDPNIHRVRIEAEIYDDEAEGLVPLDTDLNKLRKVRNVTKQVDLDRYNDHEIQEEKARYEVIKLEWSKITVLEDFGATEKLFKEILVKMRAADDEWVFCGFDTEEKGSTFQLSISFGADENRSEWNILIQMKAAEGISLPHVTKDGIPPALREFFEQPRVVFIGKDIRDDLEHAAQTLRLDPATSADLRYIELDQVFTFAYNLGHSFERARMFIFATQTVSKFVKPYHSSICPAGLKSFTRFVYPGSVLIKKNNIRDHRNNFNLHNGKLTATEITYAVLDAFISRDALLKACDDIIGLPPKRFIRKFSRPSDLLDDGLFSILRSLEPGYEWLQLSEGLAQEAQNLKQKAEGIEDHCNSVIKIVRRWQAKGEWARAKLSYRRSKGKNQFVIKKVYSTGDWPSVDDVIDDDAEPVLTVPKKKKAKVSPLEGLQRFVPPDSDDGWESDGADTSGALARGPFSAPLPPRSPVPPMTPEASTSATSVSSSSSVPPIVSASASASSTATPSASTSADSVLEEAEPLPAASPSLEPAGRATQEIVVPEKTIAVSGSTADRDTGNTGEVENELGSEDERLDLLESGCDMSGISDVENDEELFKQIDNVLSSFKPSDLDPRLAPPPPATLSQSASTSVSPSVSTLTSTPTSIPASSSCSSVPCPPPPSSRPSISRPPPLPQSSSASSSASSTSFPPPRRPALLVTPPAPPVSRNKRVDRLTVAAKSLVRRIAKDLKNTRGRDVAAVVHRLIVVDQTETCDRFLALMEVIVEKTPSHRRDTEIVAAITASLRGTELHRFAMGLVTDNILGCGRLHAAIKAKYFNLSPFILLDDIFLRHMSKNLEVGVRMFSRTEVVEVVRFVANNFNDFDAVKRKLATVPSFQKVDLEQLRGSWKLLEIRRFIILACKLIGCALPQEATKVFVAIALPPFLDAYGRGEMEDQDALPIFKAMVAGDDGRRDSAIEEIAARFPALASYLAECLGLASRGHFASSSRNCVVSPDKLHSLPGSGEVVIQSEDDVRYFEQGLVKSKYFAIDAFGCSVVGEISDRLGLISFCLRSRVFFVMPYLFPDTVAPVTAVLRRNPRLTFRYRWQRRGPQFRALFDWTPEQFLDVEEVAKEQQLGYGLDDLARRVVGVDFCRRSSNFSDLTIPSTSALRHRAIRVLLIYEDVVALKCLREQNRGLSAGTRDDGVRKRRHDFEEEDPDARHHGKSARGPAPDRRVVYDRR